MAHKDQIEKKAPAITISQFRTLLRAVLPMRVFDSEKLLLLIKWAQIKTPGFTCPMDGKSFLKPLRYKLRGRENRTERNRNWLSVLLFVLLLVVSFPPPAIASDNLETSGDVIQVLIPAIAYGTTFCLDDSEGRMQFYKSFFTNLGVTYGLKYTIDKKRPNAGGQSFPSGHTSGAFQGAAFIHKRYGWEYSIPAFFGAAFVGYSRVVSDNHYIEDVLAGAAIGVISSFYFTEYDKGVVVTPVGNKDYYGIVIGKTW